MSQVRLWEKNPRGIKENDFARLKNQIERLKVFKPLIACEDEGSGYIVLGGNMRLRAYQELGYSEVWLSIVEAPDENTRTEYALADNDRAGYYEQDKLAELAHNNPGLDLELYHVDVGNTKPIGDILKKYMPDEEDEGKTYEEKFQVVIDCTSEENQEEIFNKLTELEIKCRILTL